MKHLNRMSVTPNYALINTTPSIVALLSRFVPPRHTLPLSPRFTISFYTQYEIIHNPYTVDLLVSLAYTAAIEGALEEPPVGIALRVPEPRAGIIGRQGGPSAVSAKTANIVVDEAGLCDFDELSLPEVGGFTLSVLTWLLAYVIFPRSDAICNCYSVGLTPYGIFFFSGRSSKCWIFNDELNS